jgi:hypothetical protein
VLKRVLLDQFSRPQERAGAWSRRFDRYLKLNYEDEPVPTTVSQGASLTVTGLIVERLANYLPYAEVSTNWIIRAALDRAEMFIRESQDEMQGGFGRRSSEFTMHNGRPLILDLRHTCWAIRALLAIDATRLRAQIEAGLGWLAQHAKVRGSSDRLSWSAAVLLSLLEDSRVRDFPPWENLARQIQNEVAADLSSTFRRRLGSWVQGEIKQERAAIDNALYVLYCIKDCTCLPDVIRRQRDIALDMLLKRTILAPSPNRARGLPLFHHDQPDAGSTAQLLELIKDGTGDDYLEQLVNFLVCSLATRGPSEESFSWNLSAALVLSHLRERRLLQV